MGRRSNSNKDKDGKKRDPIIIAALIALIGTVITAILASPAINNIIERWGVSTAETTAPLLNPSGTAVITQTTNTGNYIQLNQPVSGTLYYNEAGVWIFSGGPADVTIILDVGPYGEALIILKDPDGVERAYVDAQHGREERLVNFNIPTDGEYTILVRNSLNTQVDYTLIVEDAKNPPP
jgi:hypothetical protein